ncbi:MAG: hypothetical protein J7K68_00570 [Candidatus Diapherotrites archaeon]|nr:hypothetical protein [Candidatus Diapherotrites archaeon]
MGKAQGSLEYLLVFVGILVIATIVVIVANYAVGSPKEQSTVNIDTYGFAVKGYKLVGYTTPFNPEDPATAPTIQKDNTTWSFGGIVGAPEGEFMGTLHDAQGNEYPVYGSSGGGNYVIVVPGAEAQEPVLIKECSGMIGFLNNDFTETITMLKPVSNLKVISIVFGSNMPESGTKDVTVIFERRSADGTILEAQTITSTCKSQQWCDFELNPPMSFNKGEKLFMDIITYVGPMQHGNCDDSNFSIKTTLYSTSFDVYDWMIRLYAIQ